METDRLTTNIEKEKQLLRNEIALIKRQYSKEVLNYKSDEICKSLSVIPELKNADRIAVYFSLPDEVQTLSFIEERKSEKNIYLPVIEGRKMIFRRYNGADCLKTGSFGIKEPGTDSEKAEISDIDFFIVPGVAFDRTFHRLGRGKGYYDKILVNVKKPIIGLCFNFQLFDTIPANRRDVKMTAIVTESSMFF
jgi:5-formyltetrahydrofolate cyclo-ligase